MSGRRAKQGRRAFRDSYVPRVNESLRVDPLGQPRQSARPDYTTDLSYTLTMTYPKGHPLHDKSKNPIGSPGTYVATFVLAVPGHNVVQTDVNFEELLDKGDSLIQVKSDATSMQFSLYEQPSSDTPLVTAEVGINEHHRMQYVRVPINASSFANATKLAHDAVMPMLSRWSFQHDVPITTSAVELHELGSEARKWTMTIVGSVKDFSDTGGASTADGRILLAAYREGMSTLEPLYQALCMYRVIEGAYVLRARRQVEAVVNSGSFLDPGEVLSLDQITTTNPRSRLLLESSFGPYLGKKFTRLRDDFKLKIRHAIAHIDLDGDPLAADEYEDLQKVREALPVMHHMARTLLATELSFDPGDTSPKTSTKKHA